MIDNSEVKNILILHTLQIALSPLIQWKISFVILVLTGLKLRLRLGGTQI